MENVYQPQNASAIIRSCECFGINDLHVIENANDYIVNPDIALGASKWVNVHRHTDTSKTYEQLRNSGYRIVATLPNHEKTSLLGDYDISSKTALIFGTENEGLSNTAIEAADTYIKIPMFGFTESFNISVSAGICLYALTTKMRQANIDWLLSREEQIDLKIVWLLKTVRSANEVLGRILDTLE